jgi:hemerythrin-like domain-containing protein
VHNPIEMSAPNLLNDDGSVSMATMFMMAHHALRRDLTRFTKALNALTVPDAERVQALQNEWKYYRGALHGHHMMEDERIFPHLSSSQASLAPIIAHLTEEHHRIEPLLERGDRGFEALPDTAEAKAVIAELRTLLEPHLTTEETEVVPFLREARQFPTPSNDEEVELYAQGFAWTSHGVAPEVLECLYAMLPENLTSRLPAARAEFDRRCERAWGSTKAGNTRTPIPNGP